MAEVDERECRICRGEDEPDRPLFHPCKCSGSIKYTHEDCLVNWLAQSGSARCELCNHSFRFEPLYQPNTPSALPTREFLTGVLTLTKKALKTAARIILVFTVWLFLLPVGTCWIWYALFINSLSQLPKLLESRGPAGVMTDAFYGFLLSAGIVFIFLGVSSLREYIRHFPPENHDANDDDDNHIEFLIDEDAIMPDDIDELTDDEDGHMEEEHMAGIEGHPGPDGVLHPVQGFPRHALHHGEEHLHSDGEDDIDEEVLNEVDELVRDTIEEFAGGDDSDIEIVEHDPMIVDERDDDGDGDDDYAPAHPMNRNMVEYGMDAMNRAIIDDDDAFVDGELFEDDDEMDIPIEEEDIVVDNEEDPDDLPHNEHEDDIVNVDGHEERGEGGAFFGLFDLDPDEVPLEEVVGLRGPIRNLFDNAGTVLVSNAVFLCVFTLIPLLIGRLTLRSFSMQSFPTRLAMAFPSDSPLSWGMSALYKMSVSDVPGHVIHTAKNVSKLFFSNITAGPIFSLNALSNDSVFKTPVVSTLTGGISVSKLSEDAPGFVAQSTASATADQPIVSYVDNLLIVLLGYGMIALMAVAYIGMMSMLRRRYPRLDSPSTKQVARMLRYIATFVKIVVLIMFEFGIFPLGCGWWLDMCTLDIFGGSVQSRMTYCNDSPWTCTGLHWITGIIYMVHISLFISLLREVIRPELLWFLRNPDDPEFHPFRELVEKPLSRHARRMCLSVVIYVPVIVALVYVPAQLCLRLLPTVFPFRSEDFSHILIDVPFGNLLVGPLIRLLYYGRPEVSVQKIVGAWVRWTSRMLGIADLVVKDENDRENGNDAMVGDRNVNNRGGGDLHVRDGGDEQLVMNDDMNNGNNFERAEGDPLIDRHFVDEEEDEDEDEIVLQRRQWVRLRGTFMILGAWLTLILAESALVAIPTIAGRWLMGSFGLAVRHDLHPFLLGLNIVLLGLSGMFKLGKYVRTLETGTLVTMGMPYIVMGMKGAVIVAVWLGIIPLATGILFELIVMPIRVAHNETPYFCMHQDWALGLLLLKVWACIAMTGGLGGKWRERVMRAREGDILGVNGHFKRSMKEVVIPVLVSVVTALAVPYSFARSMLPIVGASRWLCNLVYRYGYLVVACCYCGLEGLRYTSDMLNDLHDFIRDDKYLIGKRLYNFIDSSSSS